MAQCSFCREETDIYDGGDVPLCVECLDMRKGNRTPSASGQQVYDYTTLSHDFLEAAARYQEATGEFEAVTSNLRSGSPHPQRIKNASSNLTIARQEMMKAHNRLKEHFAGRFGPALRMVS